MTHEITYTDINSGGFVVGHERFDFIRLSERKFEIRHHRSTELYFVCSSLKQAIKMIKD